MPLAYAVFFLETVGALCIMFGLFTRFFAAAIGVQFLLIVFVAHWAPGFDPGTGRAAAGNIRCSGD